jgi:hypothetical protein
MENENTRDTILEAMEAGLEAQLRAVRKLRKPGSQGGAARKKEGMSQIDIVYDILRKARRPLHVAEIIERAEKLHGARLDRESLVSALAKRVARADRFVRTDPNTFALREEEKGE